MSRKWLPLAPPEMPDVWGDLFSMIPTRSGSYYCGDLFTGSGTVVGSATATLRAWCALLPSDTAVAYAGTTKRLYVYNYGAGTFTDRSKGGADYTTSTDWSFAQYGNFTFATNRLDAVQTRDSTGVSAFADATGSPPKASIVVTQAEQVLLFNLNDGAEKPDAFATSAPGDYTDWSGVNATTATRIRHRPGGITAAIAFGDYVLVFKRSSVYKLTYSGNATFKWKVQLIAIGCGAWGKHDVVNCGSIVVFNGPGGSWTYDGSAFRSISDHWGETYTHIGVAHGSYFAPLSGNVFFWTRTSSPDARNRAVAYNLVSERWGHWAGFSTAGQLTLEGYAPITGEPAALSAVFAPTVNLPDKSVLIRVDDTYPVNTSGEIYADVGQGSSEKPYIIGSIEGLPGRGNNYFSEVNPIYTRSNRLRSVGTWGPVGNTSLYMDVFTGSSVDAPTLQWAAMDATHVGTYPPTQSDIQSQTAQRRFNIRVTTPFMRFKIKHTIGGEFEIADYEVKAKSAGKKP